MVVFDRVKLYCLDYTAMVDGEAEQSAILAVTQWVCLRRFGVGPLYDAGLFNTGWWSPPFLNVK